MGWRGDVPLAVVRRHLLVARSRALAGALAQDALPQLGGRGLAAHAGMDQALHALLKRKVIAARRACRQVTLDLPCLVRCQLTIHESVETLESLPTRDHDPSSPLLVPNPLHCAAPPTVPWACRSSHVL